MIESSTMQASVEPGVRGEAEAILARLSVARPLGLDALDPRALRAEMQKGLDDFEAGRISDLSDFRRELQQEGRV